MSAYPPELYLAVHTSSEEHVQFYRRACAEARRVLELGCGAGHISCALAADGKEVVGVDIRGDLLARAEPCGARFVTADMRELALGETFDRVIAPYQALYCLLSPADLVQCLSRIRAHLAPDGLLVFDGWAADAFHREANPDAPDEFEAVAVAEVSGRTYDVYERSDWDRSHQRLDAHYRHIPRDGSVPIEACIRQRYLLSDEVAPLLARAGMTPVAMLGAFDDEAFHEDSDHLIVVASGDATR